MKSNQKNNHKIGEVFSVPVEIDGVIQPHLNALDVLKYALDVKTGRIQPGKEIEN